MRGSDPLLDQTYTLADDGQRTDVTETRNGDTSTATHTHWTYDALNRLTKEEFNQDNVVGLTGDEYTDTFILDFVGNRLAKVHDAASAPSDETISYTYNDRDQLKTETSTLNLSTTYTYDANGNTTSAASTTGTKRYVWDLRNHMTGYDANGDGNITDAGDATYQYDDNGNRVSKTIVGVGATYFLNDPQNATGYDKAIEESSTLRGTPVVSYVLGLALIAQSDQAHGTLYFLKDGHGTTRALVTQAGAVPSGQSFDYDAFLNATNFNASNAWTTWLAPDGRTDVETGLVSQGVRVTDRHIGRFLSEDDITTIPADLVDSNLYNLDADNPINRNDPLGHSSIVETLTVGIVQLGLRVGDIAVRIGPVALSTYGTLIMGLRKQTSGVIGS